MERLSRAIPYGVRSVIVYAPFEATLNKLFFYYRHYIITPFFSRVVDAGAADFNPLDNQDYTERSRHYA